LQLDIVRMLSNRALPRSFLQTLNVCKSQQLLDLKLLITSSSIRSRDVKLSPFRTWVQTFSSEGQERIRISKLIASHGLNMQMSRKSAEMLIQSGQVTLRGEIVDDPAYKISVTEAMSGIKVAGRLLRLPNTAKEGVTENHVKQQEPQQPEEENGGENEDTNQNQSSVLPSVKTRVWLAHKLSGELVAEHDPQGRPSLIERLERGGVGKRKKGKKGKDFQPVHLKPIGRLDMITEGLVLVTNDGHYKRDMELPSNKLHRTYRTRVHGKITQGKLNALRNGMEIDGTFYKGMKVNIETNKGNHAKGGNTNTWLRITCIEGKNRQIRRTLDHLGLKVTRLIRISYGDYQLNTIPPGMAIEVPVKSLEMQKNRGPMLGVHQISPSVKVSPPANRMTNPSAVQWIRQM